MVRRAVFAGIATAVLAAAVIWAWPLLRPHPAIDFSGPVDDWPEYGRDAGGARHSPLTQIDASNVTHLEIAWEYHTGDVSDGSDGRQKTTFQATPIVVGGTLYVSTVHGLVIALDPESGTERWRYDPGMDRDVKRGEFASRGVTHWADPRMYRSARPCTRRIFIATIDARLISLDAATGKRCADFGAAGQVDLKQGVRLRDEGASRWSNFGVTSPPVVIGDVVVVGSAIGDNQAVQETRGLVRAYDARNGSLRWFFDPIPRDPSDPASAQWLPEQAERTGAANVWAQLSVDHERDLVFVPTSSPSPDFYGGERLGNNAYADSVVALRGATGKVVWHFQTVHHNLWDYDLPAQPVLITLRKDGREIPAVAQATKMGFLFVLHRETGEPVYPVEERPVARSTVPGEQSSPTQPFPTLPPPLAPLTVSPDDAWGLTFWDRGKCRELIENARYEGIFTPPGFDWSLQYPGIAGGTNWGSLAFDAGQGVAVLNTSRVPFLVRLIPRDKFEAERAQRPQHTEFAPQAGTPVGLARKALLSPLELPCIAPPWGTLLAVSLTSGQVLWEVPLGTIRDIAPVPLPINFGTPNLGGPIITASGLVFIGAAMDDYLRAFDLETGEELWKGRLPAGGQATPMTYRLRENGRQYVVIAAGGHGRLGTTLGDSLVAFALPR